MHSENKRGRKRKRRYLISFLIKFVCGIFLFYSPGVEPKVVGAAFRYGYNLLLSGLFKPVSYTKPNLLFTENDPIFRNSNVLSYLPHLRELPILLSTQSKLSEKYHPINTLIIVLLM